MIDSRKYMGKLVRDAVSIFVVLTSDGFAPEGTAEMTLCAHCVSRRQMELEGSGESANR